MAGGLFVVLSNFFNLIGHYKYCFFSQSAARKEYTHALFLYEKNFFVIYYIQLNSLLHAII